MNRARPIRALLAVVFSAAAAYLGYWLALVVSHVAPRLTAYAHALGGAFDWRVDAFSVSIRLPGFGVREGFSALVSPFGLTLLLPAGFLVLLWIFGARGKEAPPRGSMLRAVLHFAGLWMVLLLAAEVMLLVSPGRGTLGFLLRVMFSAEQLSTTTRGAVAVFSAALLLAAGLMCTRRLLATFAAAVPGGRSTAALLVAAPLLLILWGRFGFATGAGLGRFALQSFITSTLAALLLLLLSARWRGASTPAVAPGPAAALGAAALAVVLFTGLANAAALHRWYGERSLARVASAHYEIAYPPARFSEPEMRALAGEREQVLARHAARLGASLDSVRIRVVLYADSQAKRVATRSDRVWSVEGTTIRAHLEPPFTSLDPAADAAALLGALWGPPGDALAGRWTARWLAGTWRGDALEAVAARIVAEEGHYTLAELLDPALDGSLSPLVREPLVAAWLASREAQQLRNFYHSTKRDPAVVSDMLAVSPEALEQAWRQHTGTLLARQPHKPAPLRPPDPAFFFRGMSFSHEGWGRRRGGYDSPQAWEQLQALAGMGVNAIAVVPYGWADGSGERRLTYTGTDETDEELAQVLHRARRLGIRVMLKPQIWVSGGVFVGRLNFPDPTARARWMERYRRFILHYARLAEQEGFDVFCIGTELGGLTPHEAEWRALIADIRRVYRGPLTYAANWGEEFETIAFWDALDYIGLDHYYPLGAGPATRAEEILPGAIAVANRVEAVHRHFGKPVLFTEVGYPSVRGGTHQPWEQQRARGVSLEEQTAAYEAVFRAYAGRDWLKGMFWWKWPSNGRGGGPNDTSITPFGKPATDVLRAWYTRMADGGEAAAGGGP